MPRATEKTSSNLPVKSGVISAPTILDHLGNPYAVDGNIISESETYKSAIAKMYLAYTSAIQGLSNTTAYSRARQPFENHAWVYAAMMAIARNIGQADFCIYREKPETLAKREVMTKAAGRKWGGAQAGEQRRAIQRHLRWKGRKQGLVSRALEPDFDHPMYQPFIKANPLMTGSQLFQTTLLWLSGRGECFWIMLDAEGNVCSYTDKYTEIWPISPEYMTPIFFTNRLVGWRISLPSQTGIGRVGAINLYLDEVIQFKYINPNYPARGMSPLIAAAAGIQIDILANDNNKAVLENGSEPGGILYNDSGFTFQNEQEEREFKEKFAQRHQGARNSRRLTLLSGGWKYEPIALSNKDMEFLEMKRWDRDEILGVLGVPKAVLSITDDLNYATQIAQDRNFWDKLLLPLVLYIESVLDGSLFYSQTDDVIGAFDLSRIDALRVGQSDKLDVVNKLTNPQNHVPPRVAFELVGMEVPEFEGDDVAVMPAMMTSASVIVAQAEADLELITNPDAVIPPDNTNPNDDDDTNNDTLVDEEDNRVKSLAKMRERAVKLLEGKKSLASKIRGQKGIRYAKLKAKKDDKWYSLMKNVHTPLEDAMKVAWRTWVSKSKQVQLDLFDQYTHTKKLLASAKIKVEGFDTEGMLEDLRSLQKRLSDKTRPVYTDSLETIYDYTVDEVGGVAVIGLDAPEFQQALDDRENVLLGSAPKTLQKNLRSTLRVGVEKGETVQQLRDRVATTFNIQASSSKTLMVARTESSGFMNEVRDTLFTAQGIGQTEWTTAGDELVREDHVSFGDAGAVDRGFNYMEIVGGDGTLEYPGDDRAPAEEVINCRCASIPVE